ncbi:MAG: tetratricopeptide repeat protein [Fuerstiella sp.]
MSAIAKHLKHWIPRHRKLRFAIVFFIVVLCIGAGCWRWVWVSWQLHVAQQQLRSGELDAALATMKSAEQIQPERPELLFTLGRAHRRAGNLQQAMPYFLRAFEGGWSAEDVRHQRYLAVIQTGRFDQAGPYLQDVLATKTEDELAYEVYEAIARGHMSTYHFKDALLCLNHFIAWRSDAITPLLWRADIHERLHNWQGGHDDYKAILSLRPDQLTARRGLADCLLELQKAKAALTEYQHCLEADPDDIPAQLGAANAHWMLGNSAEAERGFRTLQNSELLPDIQVEVSKGLAQAAIVNKQYQRAVEHLYEALRIRPCDGPATHLLGTAYSKMGKLEEAKQQLEKAKLYTEQISRFAEITQQLFEHPNDADLRWEAGSILTRQGDEKNGTAWMETALLVDPHHKKTHESLADYYSRSNQPELAARHRQMLDNLETTAADRHSAGLKDAAP